MRILIRGYYGAANLGDDVLAMVAYHAARSARPDAEVLVESTTDDYLRSNMGIEHIVAPGPPGPDDVVLLGGGGQFYDFAVGGIVGRLAGSVLPMIGARGAGVLLDTVQRARGNTARRWSNHNVAIGLGIGPYANGSLNQVLAAAILSRFDGIAVRDPQSLAYCRRWGLGERTRQFTDLAFLRRFWMPPAWQAPAPVSDRVGVVLRDWKHAPIGNSYLNGVRAVIDGLHRRGTKVTLISLDKRADERILSQVAPELPRLEWDPHRDRLADFCTELASHGCIVSARAHGAILGACLGVPAICIGIEPKLYEVAAMLSNSATVWPAPFDPATLLARIDATMTNDRVREELLTDLERNAELGDQLVTWLGDQLASIAADRASA